MKQNDILKNINPDEALAELCRQSFFKFVQVFWDEIIPETPVYNWHIPYLASKLEEVIHRVKDRLPKDSDIVINIPPGTTKSTLCTVMLPAWAWTIDPTLRIMTASYSSSLGTDHSVKSRDIIRSKKYQTLFPYVVLKDDQDNKTHYKNTKGGERYVTSVMGATTGFHAHIIIVDDPIDPNGAKSDVEREKAKSFMNTTLSTRKVDKGMTPTILVMQRLHEQDPSGNWLNKKDKKITHYCLPGELSKNVRPPELKEKYIDGLLDPVRLSKKELTELEVDLGSYGYAGQIQQTPAPEKGGIWQKWIIPIPDYNFPILGHLDAVGTDWDLAYTKKDTNSASAYITAGRKEENMYICDLGFDWLEFPSLIKYMKERPAPHYIEGKASGKSAKQVLTKNGINAIEVKVTDGDKVARTRKVTPFAESGRVFIKASLYEKLMNDNKQGILMFPNNSNDDLNDALTQAMNRLFVNYNAPVAISNILW